MVLCTANSVYNETATANLSGDETCPWLTVATSGIMLFSFHHPAIGTDSTSSLLIRPTSSLQPTGKEDSSNTWSGFIFCFSIIKERQREPDGQTRQKQGQKDMLGGGGASKRRLCDQRCSKTLGERILKVLHRKPLRKTKTKQKRNQRWIRSAVLKSK